VESVHAIQCHVERTLLGLMAVHLVTQFNRVVIIRAPFSSLATCDGIFNDDFVTDFLQSVSVKKNLSSATA